jgi:Fanconi anemia group M protein
MIKNFKPRIYQETIFNTCTLNNTLVVLPTGLGKTNIFLMIAAQRLKQYPNLKIMLLGPTRPLIEQYLETFKKFFEININDIAIITGKITPKKRKDFYKNSKIIFSTPQCIENDIITNQINLNDFSLIGFDEAHRAIGDYAYCFIADKYHKSAQYSRIIAMTASPGSDKEKINEVIKNLFIESIEVKTDNDSDVKPYIQNTKVNYIEVNLPNEFTQIKKHLESIIKDLFRFLKEIGLIENVNINISKYEILKVQASLQAKIAKGEHDFETLKGLSVLAQIMKVLHGIELIESQGGKVLLTYMQNIFQSANSTKTKAVLNLVSNIEFKTAFIKLKKLCDEDKIIHPKYIELEKIIKKNKKNKKIIFTQYRDTASCIKNFIEQNKLDSCKIFVGQSKRNGIGLSQKEQKKLIEDFKESKFNILIATSVAEEGLDIPKVDQVIFFEPIPSAIRQIQRRGRTGRVSEGHVQILMTKKTKDEAYKWSAHHKENRMYKILKDLKKNNKLTPNKECNLNNFLKDSKKTKPIETKNNNEIKVIVDHREKSNKIVKLLLERGINIELESLAIGDYLLSDRVCVEFKTTQDFINSIIDGRFLSQLKELNQYEKPMIIVEGTEDIYSLRNISPNAIKGMITTCMINFKIPILFTKNNIETAEMMKIIALKEQLNEKRNFTLHQQKPKNSREVQQFIVASFPGVGATLSLPLLKHFKSIKNIINAEIKELKKVALIGEKKAKTIKEILEKEYTEFD